MECALSRTAGWGVKSTVLEVGEVCDTVDGDVVVGGAPGGMGSNCTVGAGRSGTPVSPMGISATSSLRARNASLSGRVTCS